MWQAVWRYQLECLKATVSPENPTWCAKADEGRGKAKRKLATCDKAWQSGNIVRKSCCILECEIWKNIHKLLLFRVCACYVVWHVHMYMGYAPLLLLRATSQQHECKQFVEDAASQMLYVLTKIFVAVARALRRGKCATNWKQLRWDIYMYVHIWALERGNRGESSSWHATPTLLMLRNRCRVGRLWWEGQWRKMLNVNPATTTRWKAHACKHAQTCEKAAA